VVVKCESLVDVKQGLGTKDVGDVQGRWMELFGPMTMTRCGIVYRALMTMSAPSSMPVPSTNALLVLWYILPHEIFGVPYSYSFDPSESVESDGNETYLILLYDIPLLYIQLL